MTTIFQLDYQLNYTFTKAPFTYKRKNIGRCDIKDLDIKECLKSIEDIYDFNIVILSKSEDIFDLAGINNIFDIFISDNYSFLPTNFIKFPLSKISFIREKSIITSTMINNYIKDHNVDLSKLNKDISKLKEMSLKLDEESRAMDNTIARIDREIEEENKNRCSIM